MKLKKKTLFKIHSWIGIKLGILFFIVCFSGTLATLSNEMDWLYYPGLRATGQGERVSYNSLVREIQREFPTGTLTYWVIPDEPYLNDIAYVEENGHRRYVFVDPYKGKVTGSTPVTFQRFFRDFHYYLFMPFYQIGYFIVLVFAFFLLTAFLTALFFYKKWWQKFLELKSNKGALVFFRSLHRVVGIWSIPFAMVVTLTGIWYFIERTNIGNVSGISNPQPPSFENVQNGDITIDTVAFSYQLDYDKAAKLAFAEIPGLKIGGVVPPRKPNEAIYIRGKSHVPLVRKRANRVYVSPGDYRVVGIQKAEKIPTVMYINDIADPLHFGSWGGLITKIIWFLGGVSISGLVLTGLWIALKRQAKQRLAGNAPAMGIWKYINWAISSIIVGFMYFFMISTYSVTWTALVAVTLILGIIVFISWYVFDYRLNKAVR
ncbi:PepSY domain-containing protein [Algoriphagus sp. AGSA1]|uniref:PepSY-associated TM helix domain-containing protein n=1 Tax=Algoriphagus sp. AGSA1 TaxID=2907213 RepID=UPI001F40EBBC|nr:PepSY domain-containing protein [Algoriphagus sp. AGSA1]